MLPRIYRIPDEPAYDEIHKVVLAAADRAERACDPYPGPGVGFAVSVAIDDYGHADPSVSLADDLAGDAATTAEEFARCYWWILSTAVYPVSKHGALWTNITIETTARRGR